jgi:hypothetical protein
MGRSVIVRAHLLAAVGALVLIVVFGVSAAVSEAGGDASEVRVVRLAIVWALPALVGCLVTAGLTGRKLAGRSRAAVVRRKQRRVQIVAAAGVLVLVPSAIILAVASPSGGGTVALEVVELVAGAVNLTLLGLNFRDGRALTRPRRVPASVPPMVDTKA